VIRKHLALLVLLALSACSTTPSSSIAEIDGNVELASSKIGERYDDVMARATANYAVEPHCEQRKVALRNQRKAFLYETCAFEPEKQLFSDSTLAEVVYHFIAGDLVRIDIRAEGESALVDSVKADMTSIFGSDDSVQTSSTKNSFQWVGNKQVAGIRVGSGVNTGNVFIRLLDESLVEDIPWLAAE